MSRRIEDLSPATQKLYAAFQQGCIDAGLAVVPVQTLRTFEEQAHLYAQGRDPNVKGPIVTNAPPGSSFHNFAEAFDVAFSDGKGGVTWSGPWDKLGAIGRKVGLHWGGDFHSILDRPHFENPQYTLTQLQKMFPEGAKSA